MDSLVSRIKKKIAERLLWQVFFVLHSYFVFKLFIVFSRIPAADVSLAAVVILLITYVPLYYANFTYAFMSKKAWDKHT